MLEIHSIWSLEQKFHKISSNVFLKLQYSSVLFDSLWHSYYQDKLHKWSTKGNTCHVISMMDSPIAERKTSCNSQLNNLKCLVREIYIHYLFE